VIFFLLLVAACAGRGDARPPGETLVLKADATRLEINLPGFERNPGEHTRYTSADGRYRDDFAEWRLADDTIAGLALSTAKTGKPLTDPVRETEVLKIWPVFEDRRPAFGNPATVENDRGAIAYRRVAIGTRSCVLFLQRWTQADPRVAANGPTTLSGFYCNPSGMILPPDAALAVVRAVVLRPPLKQS
jgi:hypothetical protein